MSARYWTEITIVGLVYVIAAVVMLLGLLGYSLEEVLGKLKDYSDFLPYIAAMTLGLSYLTGFLMYRTFRAVGVRALRKLPILEAKIDFMETTEATMKKAVKEEAAVWMHGSERLSQALTFQLNHLILLVSLFLAPAVWGLVVGVWVVDSVLARISVILIFAILTWFLYEAIRVQGRAYKYMREAAYRLANDEAEGSDDTL